MKHMENFKANDVCPYFKDTPEYQQAMSGPPEELFHWVEGCVPQDDDDVWAFTTTAGTVPKAVNLQVLIADLVYHFHK